MPEVTVGDKAAYLAVPVGSPGPWPGVVVIHEAFGLNADIRGHADRLAGHSFMSSKLAPLAPLAALARLNYDKGAAEDAWPRIFAFFGQYLRD